MHLRRKRFVRREDIAGDYESVWDAIRARYGKGAMPRTVNMITGPSRSADIEQTISFRTSAEPILNLDVFDALAKATARHQQHGGLFTPGAEGAERGRCHKKAEHGKHRPLQGQQDIGIDPAEARPFLLSS